MPTVRELLEAYVAEHGFDGLFAPHGNCACKRGSLMDNCVGEDVFDCQPGFVLECPCGKHDWHLDPNAKVQ